MQADIVRVVDVYGRTVNTLRIWHDTVAYVTRGTAEKFFCGVGDKAFRAALDGLQKDDAVISALSGDFDMGNHQHVVEATADELRYLKLAEVVGGRSSSAQLFTLFMVAAVNHSTSAPAATTDSLLAAAFATAGDAITPTAAREKLSIATLVTPMPATLPEPLTSVASGPYAIVLEHHATLRQQVSAFATWAQTPLQLDRAGNAVANATRDNTINAVRLVLGYAVRVAGRDGEPDFRWLLDGTLLAGYVSWATATRKKQPSSLSLEVSCLVRILEFMSATMRLGDAADHLKVSLRRLAAQLNALHHPVTSITELEAAGRWTEFKLVQDKAAAEADAVLRAVEDASNRTAGLARRVHDALLCGMVVLDCAPNRPGCLRVLKMSDSTTPCECSTAGCPGNRFVGSVMVLTHSKTSRSRDAIRVDFAGTVTERLLRHHISWGRSLLLTAGAEASDALWIAPRGTAFKTDEAFSSYLPRVLARFDLPHLTFTTLRHAAIVAASDWASRDELEGLARSIGTSVRKLQEVYDYKFTERSAGKFLTKFRGDRAPSTAPVEVEEQRPVPSEAAAAAAEEEDYEMPPPIPPLDPLAWNASAMQPPPLPAAKRRVACGVEASTSFSAFLEARKKKPCVGGPGRSAAPVKRRLTREQVVLALRGGVIAQRAAYAYAYGYESTSGNLAWLRRKVEEAVEYS